MWPPDEPLVTVVIPCYNYGRFIGTAIRSVMAQSFQRYELIVIDDGSTDAATIAVLSELRESGIRVVRQSNKGLADTRNAGAAMARGRYLCYLDADDMLAPTYLEKTVRILESDESLGSCFSWVRCFGDMESIWRTADLDPYRLRESVTASSHSVFRKQAWEDVRALNGFGFVSKYNGYFEDWVFWIDMVSCGYRGHAIREPLILYRVHNGSLGARHKKGFDRMVAELEADRPRFFSDRRYLRELSDRLNRRIYVTNSDVNIRPGTAGNARIPTRGGGFDSDRSVR